MENYYQCRVVGRESNVGGSTYLCGPGESKRKLKKKLTRLLFRLWSKVCERQTNRGPSNSNLWVHCNASSGFN